MAVDILVLELRFGFILGFGEDASKLFKRKKVFNTFFLYLTFFFTPVLLNWVTSPGGTRAYSFLLATVETIHCLAVPSPDITHAALPAELGAFCL